MDAAAEIGRNLVRFHLSTEMSRLNPSRETKLSGTYRDRGIFVFPVQLTTIRIGDLTRLIHTLLYVMTIQKYILPGGLSAATRLREPINSGLTRWRMAV